MLQNSKYNKKTCVAFLSSIETRVRRTCFRFLLENTATRKKIKQFAYFDHQNVNSLCSRHHCVNKVTHLNQCHKILGLANNVEVDPRKCNWLGNAN